MLNQDQINQYREQGFTVFPDFLDSKQVQEFKEETESLTSGNTLKNHDVSKMEMEKDQGPEGTKVRRLYEPCTYYPVFRDYSESPKMLECIESLIGPNIICHYSKLNMKPPKIGAIVEWHQDLSYYPLTNRDSLAVLLYLDDASNENGCLKILPNSHKEPLMDHSKDGLFHGLITEDFDTSNSIDIEGKAGTAIFMNCMTPHSSNQNRSPFPRRTLIVSYRSSDAYPILINNRDKTPEKFARLVKGKELSNARFTMDYFPIPKYREDLISLYQLQEKARNGAL